MNIGQYKKKIIFHFKNGNASDSAWEELGEIILIASENGDLQHIDQEVLSEEEYKEIE